MNALLQLPHRVYDIMEFIYRRLRNQPIWFEEIEDTKGTPVGEPISVAHPTLHDMQYHMCAGELTRHVLCKGLRGKIDSFRIIDFKRYGQMAAVTTIQPCMR